MKKADLVVVGLVEGVSEAPILLDSFGAVHLATVRVEREVKGHVELSGLEAEKLYVTVRPNLSEQARLEPGVSYVLFVAQTEAGPHIVNGGQGAVRIERGTVRDGEPLGKFIQRLGSTTLDNCKGHSRHP